MTIRIAIVANALFAFVITFFDMGHGSLVAISGVAFIVNILSLWLIANIVAQRGLDSKIVLLIAAFGNLPGLLFAYWMQHLTADNIER
jgi:uncharacterized membrane protein